MTEAENCQEMRTEWKSYSMRTLDASLTSGTFPNAILKTAVFIALKNHRMKFAAASYLLSQAAEAWQDMQQKNLGE